MKCKACGGVIYGVATYGDRVCSCTRATDPDLGISLRFIRQYDPKADLFSSMLEPFPFTALFGRTAEPTVPWHLTDEDRSLLRSMRIGVE